MKRLIQKFSVYYEWFYSIFRDATMRTDRLKQYNSVLPTN